MKMLWHNYCDQRNRDLQHCDNQNILYPGAEHLPKDFMSKYILPIIEGLNGTR